MDPMGYSPSQVPRWYDQFGNSAGDLWDGEQNNQIDQKVTWYCALSKG